MRDVEQREAAASWVAMFAEGWAEPKDTDSFCDHFDPWLQPEVERFAYLDATPLIKAVALSPRAWPKFLRTQLRSLRRPA